MKGIVQPVESGKQAISRQGLGQINSKYLKDLGKI